MSIYMTRPFRKWADKSGLTHQVLSTVVGEMKEGLVDADLGSGLFKKRVARKGSGKSAGYRVLIVTRFEDKWFFIYGFPKSVRSNITPEELNAYRAFARELLAYTNHGIQKLVISGELFVVAEE